MPTSIESAWILLLAQALLIVSYVVFGSLTFDTSTSLDQYQLFYVAFVLITSAFLVANIIIGWLASRDSVDRLGRYDRVLFVLDVLILGYFFTSNNFLAFLTLFPTSRVDLLGSLSRFTEHNQNQFGLAPAIIYFLTAIFLLLCHLWNLRFYRVTSHNKRKIPTYDIVLRVMIVAMLVIAGAALFMPKNLQAQYAFLVFWVAAWLGIDLYWIFSNPMKASKMLTSGGKLGDNNKGQRTSQEREKDKAS